MRDKYAPRSNTEENTSSQHETVAFNLAPDGKEKLAQDQGPSQDNYSCSHSKFIEEIADDEKGKDIREGIERVEQLKLSLRDV